MDKIAQQDEAPSVVLSDPAIDRIFNEIDTASDRDPVKRRARELCPQCDEVDCMITRINELTLRKGLERCALFEFDDITVIRV